MAPSINHLDRVTLEAQVLDIVRELLLELGSHHKADAVRPSAKLDSQLGLGSLERVELLVRLDKAFAAHLPERVVAEAETLDDIISALAASFGATSATNEPSQSRVRDT